MIRIAVSIAGSDPSGGAGIQADLKTFSALGVYGATVITALTSQNTTGVSGVWEVPSEVISKQIDAVFSDLAVAAVKIGVLPNLDAIDAVEKGLRDWSPKNVVLDPVMVAASGDLLFKEEVHQAICEKLFPLVDIVTPNLFEAAKLTGTSLSSDMEDLRSQANILRSMGASSVLLKGGHGKTPEAIDILVTEDNEELFVSARSDTSNLHGTGCTLSSAIASELAKGSELRDAIKSAKNYITKAIKGGVNMRIGAGNGPVHHFHNFY